MGLYPAPSPSSVLERRHRCFPPIVTKYEFIQVDLELIATHAVMGTQQPLLEIADGPVRQRHCGLRPFPQVRWPRLDARHMLKAGLFQPAKLFSPSVYTVEPVSTLSLRKPNRVSFLKSGITAMRARAVVVRPRSAVRETWYRQPAHCHRLKFANS